ncbi:uncharacterized protein LOC116613927 [Nematostella vectensis]|uniref:uncharacterized protein LOC116613927 n=1 Tax=Nematostella vectensis TaxID=45351 RepID=UPI0020773C14|nr:uncharacterized protein LOC116613927 [Nematostella vectensis]
MAKDCISMQALKPAVICVLLASWLLVNADDVINVIQEDGRGQPKPPPPMCFSTFVECMTEAKASGNSCEERLECFLQLHVCKQRWAKSIGIKDPYLQ